MRLSRGARLNLFFCLLNLLHPNAAAAAAILFLRHLLPLSLCLFVARSVVLRKLHRTPPSALRKKAVGSALILEPDLAAVCVPGPVDQMPLLMSISSPLCPFAGRPVRLASDMRQARTDRISASAASALFSHRNDGTGIRRWCYYFYCMKALEIVGRGEGTVFLFLEGVLW